MKIIIQQAITAHQEGKLEEAEHLYKEILKTNPNNLTAMNNLGILLRSLGRFDEAEASYKKVIELKPDYVEAHNNLGVLLRSLGRFDEAELSYKKAIELKPDYVEAHNNLGNVLKELGRFDEAEASYKKAIELKPDYVQAHNNLGVTLQKLSRFDEAEASYKKAIEIKPDYVEAHNNLGVVLKELSKPDEAEASYKKAIEIKPDYEEALLNLNTLLRERDLIVKIFEARKSVKKNKVNNINFGMGLNSNTFISHRNVETKLLKDLYKGKLKELNKVTDARYGNGKCSDFSFFKNDFPIIKNIKEDLTNIMKLVVKSDVFIFDSFLNIYVAGSGTTPHSHIGSFDKTQGISSQKYSLTYYLSVGDQNCSEPGNLQLYDPSEEIKLTEGMVVILPAYRKHCAVYNGGKDRIMIGVNFYSLI